MATQNDTYDSPNMQVRREKSVLTVAGATTEVGKFARFQAFKLKKCHAVVVTAGTATTMGFDIYQGTTSIGAISLGTSAAGVIASSALLNASVASMETVHFKSLADATGVAVITAEFENDAASLKTV